MKTRWIVCGMAALAMMSGLGTARGQARGVQLGIDGGVEHLFANGDHQTQIGLPPGLMAALPSIRLGFPIGAHGQLETAFGASIILYEGDDSWTEFHGGLSVLLLGGSAEQSTRPFLRFGLLTRLVGDEDDTRGPQFGFGGGLGLESALSGSAAFRFEGSYSRYMEDEQEELHEMNVLAGRIGISVWL